MTDGLLACDFFIFIDDARGKGNSRKEAWSVARRIDCILQYLGIQDAPQKRRGPSQLPGAWQGGVVHVIPKGVVVLTSEEKWNKTRSIIRKWSARILNGEKLNFEELRSDRGFLIYVFRTYKPCAVFLKGINLTLESWRKDRDPEGWKVLRRVIEDGLDDQQLDFGEGPPLDL